MDKGRNDDYIRHYSSTKRLLQDCLEKMGARLWVANRRALPEFLLWWIAALLITLYTTVRKQQFQNSYSWLVPAMLHNFSCSRASVSFRMSRFPAVCFSQCSVELRIGIYAINRACSDSRTLWICCSWPVAARGVQTENEVLFALSCILHHVSCIY